jgi:hypothetical protein
VPRSLPVLGVVRVVVALVAERGLLDGLRQDHRLGVGLERVLQHGYSPPSC